MLENRGKMNSEIGMRNDRSKNELNQPNPDKPELKIED
jgi:hypothetical protein